MIRFEIKGLDKLEKELDQMQKAVSALDGKICTIQFDAEDPADVNRAIREMEAAVDKKLAPYRHSQFAKQVGDATKQRFREVINDRARARG